MFYRSSGTAYGQETFAWNAVIRKWVWCTCKACSNPPHSLPAIVSIRASWQKLLAMLEIVKWKQWAYIRTKVRIQINAGLFKIKASSVLMTERSREYVYDCCGAIKTTPCSNPLATYVKEILPSTKTQSQSYGLKKFFS